MRPESTPARHERVRAGERHHAEPPSPSLSPLRPSPCPSKCPGELHVPRRPLRTQVRVDLTPGAPDLLTPAAPRPRAAALREQRRRPARPNPPSRPIRNRRPRLEPQLFRSEPLDRDPSAQIQRYRFAMVVLHKNPSVFLESTRTPLMFKNIYGLAQFFFSS